MIRNCSYPEPTASTPISVILVEDDSLLREGLRHYLALVGMDVVAVGDCLSYYRALSERTFAVAVIDLGLPDQGGDVLVAYTRNNTQTAIIVSTGRDTLDTRVDCYAIGADLFLGKPVDSRELTAAIVSLAARRNAAGETAPDRGGQAVVPAPLSWRLLGRQRALLLPNGETLALSPKEFRLLSLLAGGDGQPVVRPVLLEALYRRDDDSAKRALETLVRRTRQKIADRYQGPNPILTQHGLGYVFSALIQIE